MEQNEFKFRNEVQLNLATLSNVRDLQIQFQILIIILRIASPEGRMRLKTEKFAEYININKSTLKTHIRQFVQSKMIKWKYSGEFFINPEFCYLGNPDDLAKTKEDYAMFRSDL